MLKIKSRTILALGVVLFLCLLLAEPEKAIEGARSGLLLWYQTVLPAQFPFAVAVQLLLKVHSFKRLPGAPVSWLIGMISGYPAGTLTVSQLYQQQKLSRKGLTSLAAYCNMAGPLFVIGTVGVGLLGSAAWGYCLLLVQWVCAGILVNFPARREKMSGGAALKPKPIGGLLNEVVGEAAELMLKIGGFVTLFSVLMQWVPGWLGCFLEITNGMRWICGQQIALKWQLTICSFLLNFSGVCVILQSLAAGEGAELSAASFFGCKLLQGIMAAAMMWGICQFLGL